MVKTPPQPKELYVLFFTEMWERFGFFTLRSALVLYMTGKLLMSEELSYALYGAFGSALYLSPLAGGFLADRVLGRKWAVILGGIFLCAGYAILVSDAKSALYLGLGGVIVGNGLFKPNISGMLGYLYAPGDARRIGGFSLFYSGVNLGAFIAALLAGGIIAWLGWDALFAVAAVGCAVSMVVFLVFQPWQQSHRYDIPVKRPGPCAILLAVAGAGICVAAFALLLLFPHLAEGLILVFGALVITHTLREGFKLEKPARNKVLGCHLMILYASLLWGLGQQAAMSLTMFAEINVDRTIFGHAFSSESFQAVNPLTIILLGPVFFHLWPRLQAAGRFPSLPFKFALGGLLMAISCFFIPLGISLAGADGRSDAIWLSLCYVVQGVGEVVVAPAGLAMISDLIPKKMTSLMYGVWLYSLSLGNLLAEFMSQLTTVSGSEDVANTNPLFSTLFNETGLFFLAVSALMFLLSAPLSRLLGERRPDGEPTPQA